MALLTQKQIKSLPALYSSEELSAADHIAVQKLFSPYSDWTWYVIEGKAAEEDVELFCYVDGHEREFGYVYLSELEITKNGVPLVERDTAFEPKKLSEIYPDLLYDD